jgi:hypothetical protein
MQAFAGLFAFSLVALIFDFSILIRGQMRPYAVLESPSARGLRSLQWSGSSLL